MSTHQKPKTQAPEARIATSPRVAGTKLPQGVVWPSDIECFYGISPPTRWRWERAGKLPARNVPQGGGGWLAASLPDVALWLKQHSQ